MNNVASNILKEFRNVSSALSMKSRPLIDSVLLPKLMLFYYYWCVEGQVTPDVIRIFLNTIFDAISILIFSKFL